MAIAFGAASNAQSKTAGTSLASAALSVTANDLLLIAFASDDVAGTYTPSDGSSNTYTLAQSVINAANVRTQLWYATASATASITATVTHPSLTARGVVFARFTGVGALDQLGGGEVGALGSSRYISNKTTTNAEELFVGVAGWEGPDGDTTSVSNSGTPVLTNIFPTNGKIGTTGGGAASNVTLQFAYAISTAAETGYYGDVAISSARDNAGAGAIFNAAAAAADSVPYFRPYPQLLAH